jgi:hypothetical protein
VTLLIDAILRIGLTAATGFLFVIILLSYLRIRNTRLLFIATGFGIFFIHALLYMPDIMFQSFTIEFTENLHIALNLVALLLIAVGIIRE